MSDEPLTAFYLPRRVPPHLGVTLEFGQVGHGFANDLNAVSQ